MRRRAWAKGSASKLLVPGRGRASTGAWRRHLYRVASLVRFRRTPLAVALTAVYGRSRALMARRSSMAR